MTYEERLKASQEELDAAQVSAKASEADARLAARISTKRAEVVALKNQRENTLNSYPLNVDAVINANHKVASSATDLEELEALHAELFGGKASKK